MDSFFSRYRNFLVLFALLLAQIVGLAVQVRRTADGRAVLDPGDGPGVRLIRYWAETLVALPEGAFHYSKLGVFGLWQNYLDLHYVRQQNKDLQQAIDRLRLEQASLLEDARQGQRLQSMLGFQQSYIYTTLPAQAIGSSGSDLSRVFYIDKGSANGLKSDMAVITADGIVGKVRDVFPHTAQVLAVNDQTSGAGVILETTRTRGILRGNAAGQLEIVGIMSDQRIKPGEKVLTAGGDMIFPRGLPVGEVVKVLPDPDRDSCILVLIKPAAHLDRLDEVLVITSTQARFSDQQQQDIATSEAQKAPDLATINEQKKASEIMAERLPGLNDPNLPAPPPPPAADQQQAQPQPVTPKPLPPARSLPALHSDRFSPSINMAPRSTPAQQPAAKTTAKPATPTAVKPGTLKPATARPGTAKPGADNLHRPATHTAPAASSTSGRN
ncbi:MAG: rod shape-determining protein MreC [Terracidiphilus sp.]|nr:rod shape-determining protein MreC [Terracidiphilus sp.]